MKTVPIPYKRQIFVCVNDRQGESPSCGDHQGEAVFRALREEAKARGVHPRIRVTQAKCLGPCAAGVTVMIYPENLWLSGVRLTDVPVLADAWLAVPSAS